VVDERHDQRYDEVDDIARARPVPSLQLAGSPDRKTLDLKALTGIGVTRVGRIAGIFDGKAQFSGSLHNNCAMADLKMNRLLDTIDDWAPRMAWTARAMRRTALPLPR
jgi:putative flavoprotein involved in K+ transport